MHTQGHTGIGLLLYSPVAFLLLAHDLQTVFGLGLVGIEFWSVAPDVDIELPMPHRGPTHSFVAVAVAGVLTSICAVSLAASGVGSRSEFVLGTPAMAYGAAAGFGFGIGVLGVLGHLLGDVVTPMGLRPWWPLSERHVCLDLVPSNDAGVNRALSLVGALAIALAVGSATLV